MGGCATKPGVVKEQGGEAPLPLEQPAEVDVSGSKVEGEEEDEGKRTSLSHLFREVCTVTDLCFMEFQVLFPFLLSCHATS